MGNDSIARVSYFERQFLRTQDFVDEQAYHLAMRRRHNIAHHRWGIVEGLRIVEEEGSLFVQPGVAIDGYGREVILSDKLTLPSTAFTDKGSSVLDVSLIYNRLGSDPAPKGFATCGDDGSARAYRWQERPEILITISTDETVNARQPANVPAGDFDFDPTRLPPDDPQQDWPIFLGRVTQVPQKPFIIDHANRPYVGLVGESIIAPSRKAKLKLGAEDPERPFAVFVAADNVDKEETPIIAINADKQVEINSDTSLRGNLTMASGAIEFNVGSASSAPGMRIYRDETSLTGPKQLRIEVDKDAPGINEVAIGHWSEDDKQFEECLTVDENCNVTIHGNLVVEGKIALPTGVKLEDVITTVPPSTEVKRFMVSSGLAGIGGSPVLLQLIDRIKLGSPASELVVPALETAATELRTTLKSNEAQLNSLLDTLTGDEELRQKVQEALARKPAIPK